MCEKYCREINYHHCGLKYLIRNAFYLKETIKEMSKKVNQEIEENQNSFYSPNSPIYKKYHYLWNIINKFGFNIRKYIELKVNIINLFFGKLNDEKIAQGSYDYFEGYKNRIADSIEVLQQEIDKQFKLWEKFEKIDVIETLIKNNNSLIKRIENIKSDWSILQKKYIHPNVNNYFYTLNGEVNNFQNSYNFIVNFLKNTEDFLEIIIKKIFTVDFLHFNGTGTGRHIHIYNNDERLWAICFNNSFTYYETKPKYSIDEKNLCNFCKLYQINLWYLFNVNFKNNINYLELLIDNRDRLWEFK